MPSRGWQNKCAVAEGSLALHLVRWAETNRAARTAWRRFPCAGCCRPNRSCPCGQADTRTSKARVRGEQRERSLEKTQRVSVLERTTNPPPNRAQRNMSRSLPQPHKRRFTRTLLASRPSLALTEASRPASAGDTLHFHTRHTRPHRRRCRRHRRGRESTLCAFAEERNVHLQVLSAEFAGEFGSSLARTHEKNMSRCNVGGAAPEP